MTIDPPSARTEVNAFIGELRRFINACCLPSDRELVRRTGKVIAANKAKIPELREVTQAVLSRVMTGKRQRPPAWGWVATVVLTCLDFHAGSGTELDFDGPVNLQQWYTRYQQMLDSPARVPAPQPATGPAPVPVTGPGGTAAEQVPPVGDGAPPTAPVTRRGAGGSTGEDGGEEPIPMDGPVSATPPAPPGPADLWYLEPPAGAASVEDLNVVGLNVVGLDDGAIESWLPLMHRLQSRAHRRYYALLGQHGVDLLSAAENGDPEAASRLGILLLCHDTPAEGLAWLQSAADAGDEPGKILINATDSQRRQMAAELAYEFTLPGYAQDHTDGRPTNAEVYYRAAAAAGHLGATIRMGLIYEARGEFTTALHTYAQAAARAHPGALDHYARLSLHLAREQAQYHSDEPPQPM